MDNQQATSWFVGILEGEGTFSKGYHSGVRIRISNTEIDIINICSKILTSYGVIHNISSSKRVNRKEEYEICISSFDECTRLYLHLQNKIQCRHQELEQIIGASETTRDGSSDLWWLIGFLEAEGSFHICQRTSRQNEINYNPEITVSNTRFSTIDKVAQTLYSNSCSWHISHYTPEKYSEYKVVTIRGYSRVQRFLKLTANIYQSSRIRKKVNLLLEFCNTRLLMPKKSKYTDRQHEIFHVLRNMI